MRRGESEAVRLSRPLTPPVSSITGRAAGPGRAWPGPSAARLPVVTGPARLRAAAPRARLMAAAPPPRREPPQRGGGGNPSPPHRLAGPGRSIAARSLTAGPARGFSRAGSAWAAPHTGMAGGKGEPPRPVETAEPRRLRLFNSCQDLARGGGAHRAGGGEARWRWRWR